MNGGLRGGEIGAGEVALAAIGQRDLVEGFRRFRLAPDRGLEQRDRLVGMGLVVGRQQRLRRA